MNIIWLNCCGNRTDLEGRLDLPDGTIYGHVLWLINQAVKRGIIITNKERVMTLYRQTFYHTLPSRFIERWQLINKKVCHL